MIGKQLAFALLFVLFTFKLAAQDTIQLRLDVSRCYETDIDLPKGHLGLYSIYFHPSGSAVPSESLVKTLDFSSHQEIILDRPFNYYKLKFIPSDSLTPETDAHLSYLGSPDDTLVLDCYFFRQPLSLLEQMAIGDTIGFVKEYVGNLNGEQQAPRSEISIIRTKKGYFYARSDASLHGNPGILPYGLDIPLCANLPHKELTSEQIECIKSYENHIAQTHVYSYDHSFTELKILENGLIHRFMDGNRFNSDDNYIWELLE